MFLFFQSNKSIAARKESTVRYPGASGFCYQESEFCSYLARSASEVFWVIELTEDQSCSSK